MQKRSLQVAAYKNGFGIRLNTSGEKNSVKKNLSSIWIALGYIIICSKKMSSIRMAWAICLKKLLSARMADYPFKKEIV